MNKQIQTQTGDSLILSQVRLASLIMTIDISRSDSLLEEALSASVQSDFIEGRIRAILVQAAVANYQSRLVKSRELLDRAIELSEASQFDEGLAYAYTTLGSQLLRRSAYAEAIENHFEGASYAGKLGLFDVEVTNLLNI